MKLLIVDDNREMRRLLRRIVAGLFTEIRECADGAEAITEYDAARPDWVLMDIEMEQADGLTAASRIMADHPDARIVIVTNYDSDTLRQTAQRSGVCGYILKDNLLEVRRLLGTPAERGDCSDDSTIS